MPASTRTVILEAARAELLEKQWEATTGAGVKARAGKSQGSWAHAFPGSRGQTSANAKAQVAAALYKGLHEEAWLECLDVFDKAPPAQAPTSTLQNAYSALLGNVVRFPALWRLLHQLQEALPQFGYDDVVSAQRHKERDTVAAWATRLKPALSAPVALSAIHMVVLGPVTAAARDWLAEGSQRELVGSAPALAATVAASLGRSGGRKAGPSKLTGEKKSPDLFGAIGSKSV